VKHFVCRDGNSDVLQLLLSQEKVQDITPNNPKFLISGPKFWNNPENQQRFMKRVGDELGIKEVLHILLPHLTKY